MRAQIQKSRRFLLTILISKILDFSATRRLALLRAYKHGVRSFKAVSTTPVGTASVGEVHGQATNFGAAVALLVAVVATRPVELCVQHCHRPDKRCAFLGAQMLECPGQGGRRAVQPLLHARAARGGYTHDRPAPIGRIAVSFGEAGPLQVSHEAASGGQVKTQGLGEGSDGRLALVDSRQQGPVPIPETGSPFDARPVLAPQAPSYPREEFHEVAYPFMDATSRLRARVGPHPGVANDSIGLRQPDLAFSHISQATVSQPIVCFV